MLKTSIMLISVGAVGASLLGWRMRAVSSFALNQKISNLSVTVGNANTLLVDVPLGHVVLIADQSRDLTVHVVRSAKVPSDPAAQKWLDDSVLSAENRGDLLVVRDRPFGKDNLSEVGSIPGSSSKPTGSNVDVLVQIHVPVNLQAKVKISAGQLEIIGRFHGVAGSVAAGNIDVTGLQCQERSEFKVGAGNLNVSVPSRSHATSSLHVGAGEVKLVVPSGASADVSANVGIGEITGLPGKASKQDGIHLGDRRHGRTGSGDSKVDIHVGTGSIKVDARDHVEATTVLDEPSENPDGLKDLDDRDFADLDGTIKESVRMALESAKLGMSSLPKDIDFKVMSDQDFKGMDKDLSKSLEKLGPEIEKAMESAKPDIEKAMRTMKPEIEKAIRTAQAEVRKSLKDMKPEIEKALKEAIKELDQALKEIDKSEKIHGE